MATNDDGSVEIRITGTVDPSVAASTAAANAAIAELSQSQKTYFDIINSGKGSFEQVASGLSKNAENMLFLAGISKALAAQQAADSASSVVAVGKESLARIAMSKEDSEQLRTRMGLTKQAAAEEETSLNSIAAFQQRMTKQRIAEAQAEYDATYTAAQRENAAYDQQAAALARIVQLKAEQAGANFSQDVNAATGVTGLADKDAKASAAVFVAAEKEKQDALKATAANGLAASVEAARMAREEDSLAASAERAAAGAAKQALATVPLYAAQQRLASATTAANAALAAGTVDEAQHAAVVAAATAAYDKTTAALVKEGLAIKSDTGELIANAAATEIESNAKSALFAKLTSGRSVMEAEAFTRAALTGNMARMDSALAVEAARLNLVQYAFSGVGLAVTGAIAALVAFGVAASAASKAAQWAEELKRSADVLGLTTTQLQEFDFVFKSMGIDVDKGRSTLKGLEQTIGQVEAGGTRAKQATKLFKDELSITPENLKGWGDLKDQIPQIVDALSKMNVEERETAEKKLKVDPEVIQSLIDAKGRLNDLIAEAHNYGVIVPASVVDTSAAAADKMREWKEIIDGELRSAFITLAPLVVGGAKGMADFAQKFADGARGAIDAVANLNKLIGSIDDFAKKIDVAVPVLREFDNLLGFGGKTSPLKGIIDDIKDAAENALNPLGHLIGMFGQLGAEDREKQKKALAGEPKTAPQGPPPTNLLGPTTAAKKGPDQVSEWAEMLHAQEVASNDFFGDQTAKELTFWQSKLALTTKGSKDWLEVQSRIYEAAKTLAHKDYDEHLNALEEQANADKDHWSKYRADLQAEADYILQVYKGDKNVTAYKDALKRIEDAEKEHGKELKKIQSDNDKEALTELKSNLATAKTIRDADAKEAEAEVQQKAKYSVNPLAEIQAQQQISAMRRQTSQQNISDLDAEQAKTDEILQNDINAADKDTKAWADANKAKETSDLEWANKRKVLIDQMVNQEKADAQKIAQSWHSIVDPMVQSTGTQIQGLITGTETWGQALQNIGKAALGIVIQAIERMAEAWIVSMITGQSSQKATALTQVASYAGIAGAAGVASYAGAPWPIDLGAPAFGAAMMANAMAYSGLASLDVGTNYVPHDMPANIHEGEGVLPKADNTALRAAVARGTSGGGGGHTFNFGDFNVQGGPSGMSPEEFQQSLSDHSYHVATAVASELRNGFYPSYKQPTGRL